MDTDDCSEDTRAKYIDKRLFSRYELKEYVIPIYTTPDLAHVLFQCNLIPKIFNDSEKVREYGKIFPISREPHGVSKIDDMRQLSEILKKNKNTNMEKFIDYCISMAELRKANL